MEKIFFEQNLENKFPDVNELTSFGGFDLDSSPEQLYVLFNKNKNNGNVNFIHYLYDLHTCSKNEEAELLALGIGHYSDEIEVPILEAEQWWLDKPEE